MKILKITAENFRGNRNVTYDFSDKKNIVKGMNGSGKSTIPSMIYWVMVDRDVSLTANPQVRTIGAIDEQQTVVTIDCDFDGKPVQVQKSQKLKRSKYGTVALTNSYMVNSVPKSEKDFKAYLTELGVDFDKFLPCSHPSVMLAGINNKKERTALRNMLFEMASDITDLDVAKQGGDDLLEIAMLLTEYKSEEVEAMQNATLRKIRENYGKEGEILRAKIEGLESAKDPVDTKFHQAEADKYSAEIEKVKKQLDLRKVELEKARDAQGSLMEKKFELTEIENRANSERAKKKNDAEGELFKLEVQKSSLETKIHATKEKAASVRSGIEQTQTAIRDLTEKMQKCIDYKFDPRKAICPTCGQELPKEKLDSLKEEYETKAKNAVKKYSAYIKDAEQSISESERLITENEELVKDARKTIEDLENKIEVANQVVIDAVNTPEADMSVNEDYQKVLAEIEELEKTAGIETGVRLEIRELTDKIEKLKGDRDLHLFEISKEKQNMRIDEQISQLRVAQKNYEQQKADAEMILDQLKTLNMKKNELLQESVNKNFKLVDFILFTTLKNGEVKDACIPTINGKRFGESMNNALEVLAKIDVMDSIQRFYGLDYPIILDNAECLDSESMKQIETDHQLIMLCVSDNPELVFEKGE